MSDQSDKKNPLDLSALDFGPSWARDAGSSKSEKTYKDHPGDARGGKNRRTKERPGRDRRSGRGGGARDGRDNDSKRKGHKRGDRGGERRRPARVEPPQGVTAQIMPIEQGVDNLAKEIAGSGRTYSVFQLAQVVLGARERFNMIFQSEQKEQKIFFQSQRDDAVFLTKQECLTYAANEGLTQEFYTEEVVEVEPPKGNFQSIATCGISGETLGPPNYHAYSHAVAELHRTRFAHMDLAHFKSKIITEAGEEAVQAWLESMKTSTQYRAKSEEQLKKEADDRRAQRNHKERLAEKVDEVKADVQELVEGDAEEAEVVSAEAASEAMMNNNQSESEDAKRDSEGSDEVKEANVDSTPEEVESSTSPATATDSEGELLGDATAMLAHFEKNYFDRVFRQTHRVSLPSGVAGKCLSPSLLTLLRETISDQQRYPGRLASFLCRQLSGRHLAVFKWKGKLYCGPSRPHVIAEDTKLAERPQRILDWLDKHSGLGIDKLWSEVFPSDIKDEDKRKWFADLHWLLNQGHVILMSDGHLFESSEAKKPRQSDEA